jgi:hypothetical protein
MIESRELKKKVARSFLTGADEIRAGRKILEQPRHSSQILATLFLRHLVDLIRLQR